LHVHSSQQILQASPLHRSHRRGEVLDIVTLNYRAPELLFGDVAFGAPIDVWALGLVVVQAAGAHFHIRTAAKAWTPEVLRDLLFIQLGTPSSEVLRALPLFPSGVVPSPAAAWPDKVVATLGTHGMAFVVSALAWEPLARPRASELLKHQFFKPPMMTLGGMLKDSCGAFVAAGGGPYQGERCPWNILHGEVGSDVLKYLQGDPALTPGHPDFKALRINFKLAKGARENAKSELGCKYIMAGHMGPRGNQNATCCVLSLAEPLPLRRLQAWFEAFLVKNRESLDALRLRGKNLLYRLSEEERGPNGNHFMSLDVDEWFGNCAELVVLMPSRPDGSFVQEELHTDGGASVLHMGLTLYGRRLLRCKQGHDLRGNELPDVWLENKPGTLYLGGLTGPEHQVFAWDGRWLLHTRVCGIISGSSISGSVHSGMFMVDVMRTDVSGWAISWNTPVFGRVLCQMVCNV
jgi:hypothetical protein